MDEGGNDADMNVLVCAEGAVDVLPTGMGIWLVRWFSGALINSQGAIADFARYKVGVFRSALHGLLYKWIS